MTDKHINPHPEKQPTPTSESPVKKGGWCLYAGIGCLILIGLLSLLFFGGLFWGLNKYKGELQKAGFQYDPNKKSIKVKNPETGEEFNVGENVKAPDNFPKGLLYPNAKVATAVSSDKNPSVTLYTQDGSKLVQAYYAQNLPKKGWTIKTSGAIVEIENATYIGSVTIVDAPQKDQATTTIVALERKSQ